MHKEVFRLAVLLAALALATSRIGLFGHELVGHGGTTLALGGEVLDVEMFWFAGGWIRFKLAEPSLAAYLAIAMAGIALELVVGIVLWLAVRGETLGRRLVRGIGAALVIHATWYLATGAFHGFGDGQLLYRVLGDARAPVAIAAGLATCVASFFAARSVMGALTSTLPGSRRARVAGALVAALLGGGVHAGLTAGELAVRRDVTYGETMQHERDRRIAIEMRRWQRERGEVSADAARVERARLERTHRTFPFVWFLLVATGGAMIAGAWRQKIFTDERISQRFLTIAVLAAVTSVLVVAAINGIIRA